MKTYQSFSRRIELKSSKDDYFKKAKIVQSSDAVEYIRQFYSDDIELYESVFIVLLNRSNNTIGWAKIGQGGVTATIVDTRLIVKYALETLACGVILAHNHPSGSLSCSASDDGLTKKVKEGLSLFDIQLLDHVILTTDGYLSYADEGKL